MLKYGFGRAARSVRSSAHQPAKSAADVVQLTRLHRLAGLQNCCGYGLQDVKRQNAKCRMQNAESSSRDANWAGNGLHDPCRYIPRYSPLNVCSAEIEVGIPSRRCTHSLRVQDAVRSNHVHIDTLLRVFFAPGSFNRNGDLGSTVGG